MDAEDKGRDEPERTEDEQVVEGTSDELEPLADSPESDLVKLLEDEEDPAKKKRLISIVTRFTQSMIIPVPFPELIEGYEQATPGGGQWLLDYSKAEQKHRQAMETKGAGYLSRGQVFGFVLGLVGLGGGIFLTATGATASGLSVFFGSLISLVGLFLYNQRGEGDEEVSPPEPPGGDGSAE